MGTQELILVGMVALIVFGPRKLPEMARKAGKMMRELRSVSNDFKSTWEQEVVKDVTEIKNTFAINDEEDSVMVEGVADKQLVETTSVDSKSNSILPEVREVSEEDFKKMVEKSKKAELSASEKQDWL